MVQPARSGGAGGGAGGARVDAKSVEPPTAVCCLKGRPGFKQLKRVIIIKKIGFKRVCLSNGEWFQLRASTARGADEASRSRDVHFDSPPTYP